MRLPQWPFELSGDLIWTCIGLSATSSKTCGRRFRQRSCKLDLYQDRNPSGSRSTLKRCAPTSVSAGGGADRRRSGDSPQVPHTLRRTAELSYLSSPLFWPTLKSRSNT
jgi:hypothetical protein